MADVLIALNENGTDGSTTFIDQSSSAHVLTASGNAQWDTAQFPTGMSSSGLFDGTTDLISSPDHDDWNLGAGDFGIQGMVRFNSIAGYGVLATQWDKSAAWSNASWNVLFPKTGDLQLYFQWSTTGSNSAFVAKSWSPSLNTWYHVEIDRSGTNLYFFVDGTQIGTTGSISATLFDSTANMTIGAFADGSLSLNGWLSNVAVKKGAPYHTANFTPPALPLSIGHPAAKRFGGIPFMALNRGVW